MSRHLGSGQLPWRGTDNVYVKLARKIEPRDKSASVKSIGQKQIASIGGVEYRVMGALLIHALTPEVSAHALCPACALSAACVLEQLLTCLCEFCKWQGQDALRGMSGPYELGAKACDELTTKWVLLLCKPNLTDRLGLTVQLPEKVYARALPMHAFTGHDPCDYLSLVMMCNATPLAGRICACCSSSRRQILCDLWAVQ